MENISLNFQIERNDIANAGTVSSLTKRHLKKRGLSRSFVKRVTIGVYEAEINVVIHSYGGTANLNIENDYVEIEFKDVGPGIECISTAMQEGYSTASPYAIENGFGAGMGLPNIQAVSDEMDLQSSVDGTHLYIKFNIDESCYES